MVPYASFLYLLLLAYVLAPVVALRLVGRFARAWLVVAFAGLLVLQYSGMLPVAASHAVRELWVVLGWAGYEMVLLGGFVRARQRSAKPLGRPSMAAAVLLALAPLLTAKYLSLLAAGHELGFLGISYTTFRALDVLFEAQDGLVKSTPPGQLAAYLLFLPTISSGPVDRYRRFGRDWTAPLGRAGLVADLDAAVHGLFTGLLYKFIIAQLIAKHWLEPAGAGHGPLALASYIYAYTFYLFFDFAGYSQFAIAAGRVCGVRSPQNFNRPFLAVNIRDFWNRWHMSLSYWFRDHVYMRFLLANGRGGWVSNKLLASCLGYLLTFGLMGLWHGPTVYYAVYGLYHAGLMSGYEVYTRLKKRRGWVMAGPAWRVAGMLLTFHAVVFGLLIFSGRIGPGATATVAGSFQTAGPPPQYEGTLDEADANRVAGWAWDMTRPDAAVDVEVLCDGQPVATVAADGMREDLRRMMKGTGRHAFAIAAPARLRDGRPHVIRAHIAGVATDLAGSPITLTPPSPPAGPATNR